MTSSLHLEHIYPKRPKEADKLVDHDSFVSRYGNLTLLDGSLNKSIGNSIFDKKVESYKSSSIDMTKALVAYDGWGKEQIDKRQAEMAAVATKVWTLDV